MRPLRVAAGLALACLWMAVVVADVWDPEDNSWSTTNELVHGSAQVHSLGNAGVNQRDIDFFRIGEGTRSSYEIVVDGPTSAISGGLGDLLVQRYAGAYIVQTAEPYHEDVGFGRSLRWENLHGSSHGATFIRVTSTALCPGLCSSNKTQYQIRAYETTYSIPRFNNAGSQVTILQIQNTSSRTVTGRIHFWRPQGTLLGAVPFSLGAQGLLVLNTATWPFAAGQAGSITVSNTGHYGVLSGKAVALDPSTGFTFDTAMVPRPH